MSTPAPALPRLYAVTGVHTNDYLDIAEPFRTATDPAVAALWYLENDHPDHMQATLYTSADHLTWSPGDPAELVEAAYRRLASADSATDRALRGRLVAEQADWLDARLRPEESPLSAGPAAPYGVDTWRDAGQEWAAVLGSARDEVLDHLVTRYPTPQDEGLAAFRAAVADTEALLHPLRAKDAPNGLDLATALNAADVLDQAERMANGSTATLILSTASHRYLDRAFDLDPRTAPLMADGATPMARRARELAHQHLRPFHLQPDPAEEPGQRTTAPAWKRFNEAVVDLVLTSPRRTSPPRPFDPRPDFLEQIDLSLLDAADVPRHRDALDLEAAALWRHLVPGAGAEADAARTVVEQTQLHWIAADAQQPGGRPAVIEAARTARQAEHELARLGAVHAALGHLTLVAQGQDTAQTAAEQMREQALTAVDLYYNASAPAPTQEVIDAEVEAITRTAATRLRDTVTQQQHTARIALNRLFPQLTYSTTPATLAAILLTNAAAPDEQNRIASVTRALSASRDLAQAQRRVGDRHANGLAPDAALVEEVQAAQASAVAETARHRLDETALAATRRALAVVADTLESEGPVDYDRHGAHLLEAFGKDLAQVRYPPAESAVPAPRPVRSGPRSPAAELFTMMQWIPPRPPGPPHAPGFDELDIVFEMVDEVQGPAPAWPRPERLQELLRLFEESRAARTVPPEGGSAVAPHQTPVRPSSPADQDQQRRQPPLAPGTGGIR